METLLSTLWKRKRGDEGPVDASSPPSAAACTVQLGEKSQLQGEKGGDRRVQEGVYMELWTV